MWSEKDEKERELNSAKVELSKVDAAILLVKNNNLACEVHIAGLVVGLCNNKKVLPALKYHKGEIEKFIKGEKNEWE